MTFGILNVLGVISGRPIPKGSEFFLDYTKFPPFTQKIYDYMFHCHYAHLLEFLVSLCFYIFLWPMTFSEAQSFKCSWVLIVILYNLSCEFIFFGFWHFVTHGEKFGKSLQKKGFKYNKEDPYQTFSQNLSREITYTTLGWLHSSIIQIVVMFIWANNLRPNYSSFWEFPAYSIFHLLLISYWREFHFYIVHRMIHPWGWKLFGVVDVGSCLYSRYHSLHHKSYNPGPFSGLSMHPVEHFFYYSCALLPLLYTAHPLHFLYAKFHCDLSPIGGHDGYAYPGGGVSDHWLHHQTFECNYGTPLINLDRLFGTELLYDVYLEAKGDFGKAMKIMRERGKK